MFSAAQRHSFTTIECHRIGLDARNICIFHIFFLSLLPISIEMDATGKLAAATDQAEISVFRLILMIDS